MYLLIISLAIFSAILLVLVILAQNSKGGGLSSQFGGSGASNIIGVKKTGDVLEQLTWGFIIAIIVLTLASTKISPTVQSSGSTLEKVSDQPTPEPIQLPSK